MKLRTEYTCPLELTHDITRGKWKSIIMWKLGRRPYSLADLKREIRGISQKMLIQQLRELSDYKFVSKKTFEGYPLRVEYSLTERGKEIFQALLIMQKVGIEIMIEDGRENFLKEKGILPV